MQRRLNHLRLVAVIVFIAATVLLARSVRSGRLGDAGTALGVASGPAAGADRTAAAEPGGFAGATPTPFSALHDPSLPAFAPDPVDAGADVGAPAPAGGEAVASGTDGGEGGRDGDAAAEISRSNRVGVIPGHWQFDTGAVCSDGRREVDVTTDVALRLQALLEYRGYEVDLLPEHHPSEPQPPIQGYRGAALVSIHADSCDVAGASGFKVARWAYSQMPEVEDRLVDCLVEEYGTSTMLPEHVDSITVDMLNYYAFRELALETPAAIVELGFLQADREVLDDMRYEMALGIANGVSCFLESQ
ncbi:MAG: N-acetylmuramoyl-L-alanine amidase [Anaerolineae bacterium]|jgi:N-acetylmuramoyl-L-alanine amidase